MRLYEYEAKEIFRNNGIPVPEGKLVLNAEEVIKAYNTLAPAIIKSQVLVGGRGKAGGIKFPENEAEAKKLAEELLSSEIKGYKIRKLLIEKKLNIKKELYFGVTIDKIKGEIVVIVSSKGGVDIEEVAKKFPNEIIKRNVDIYEGLPFYEAMDMVRKIGLRGDILKKGARVLSRLYNIFTKYDAEIAEINPLVVTDNGDIVAADAKLNVDSEALYRHPEIRKEDEFLTELEKEARANGLGYVEMGGNIGVIGNGAGLNMTTLDILRYFGGTPANFLEVSGRTYMLAEKAVEIILKNPNVKVIFGNFFGSAARCDVIAEGLAKAFKKGKIKKPFIVSMRGMGAKEGRKLLRDLGIEVYENDEEAAKRVVELVR
ncbi:MAG: ADP-forming succinate--CoA ligase subunit beta [Candidatus Marinimicrobia bacterium]|nr:ADP-forming succinate--CoA ligase subunit beta [Candidatus Neomarinimicrobiota bacterium]